jgi:hypothetical protein
MDELQQVGIQTGHRVALLIMSLVLLGFVLELVRRDLLEERYALLWLATSLFGVVIGIFPVIIVKFAVLVRFQMLTALFVFAFLFFLGIVLGFSTIISRQTERSRKLAQEVALLTNRVQHLEGKDEDA